MAKISKIAWTHGSFNPWAGCAPVSPACDHCYAETWAKSTGFVGWGPHAQRRRTSAKYWNDPIKWNAEAVAAGARYRVFTASLADIFDNAAPDAWREDLWALVRATPNLDWIVCTKRIGNAPAMLPTDWGHGYPNVWLLITVTDQHEAERDIPKLLAIPAVVHGLSMEPLLGPVRFARTNLPPANDGLSRHIIPAGWLGPDAINWVIVGAESTPRARPLDLAWVRSIHDQCKEAGTAFFLKQLCERGKPIAFEACPDDLRLREFPVPRRPKP